MHVPSGTPSTFATVRPVNISAIGAGPLLRGDQVGGDHRADAEERAVRERGDDPADHQHGRTSARARRAGCRPRTAPIRSSSIFLRGTGCPATVSGGRADHDAEGVAGDEQAGGRDGDAEVGGDLGQQAHDHELGGADAEGADGQGEQGERHGTYLSGDCVWRLQASTIVADADINASACQSLGRVAMSATLAAGVRACESPRGAVLAGASV